MRFTSAATLVAVLLPAAAAGQATPSADQAAADSVERVFAEWNSRALPGCAAAVARRGDVVLQRAWGMADLEHDVQNTPATIFEAGSVSKQFTAAAVLLLAEDGLLSLDDDVRRYVPELPEYEWTITLRHLLNHTSGLRDWGSVAAIAGWGRSDRTHTHAHVLDILSRQSALNFEPGAEYSYSNSGYNLLAIIVDRVSGQPFAEFSRERIFEPLGLRDTRWRDDYRRIVKGRASAYVVRDGTVRLDRPIEDVHGNGGLLTTVGDLLAWNRALAENRLGGPDFTARMRETGVLNDGSAITYALGLTVDEYRGVREVSHTGATSGYRAFLAHYPDQDVDVAVLCNVGNVSPGRVGHAVADAWLGDALEAVPTATRVDDDGEAGPEWTLSAPAEYAGTFYSADAETTFNVVSDDGALVLERRPAARMQLRAVEQDTFVGGIGRIRFLRDERGRVTGFSLSQGRVHDLRFQRVDGTRAP